ncbi:MAG: choice-of-anchor D domain-containing protein [Gemmatimonadota bacterium]
MSCTPLSITPGLFLTASIWENTPSKTFDGKSLTLTTTGGSPGLSVQQGGNNIFHPQLANRTLRYRVLGNKFLVILDSETTSPSTRSVSLVDFTKSPWTEVNILTVLTSSTAVAPPIVNESQGNGAVFLAFGQDGTNHTSVAIHRSDTGATLCSLGSPIVPTGQTAGEATATQLIIHFSTGGTSHTQACALPAGNCQVTPSLQSFADVAVGGCPFTPETKQFTIKNTGDDCLTISAIANAAPFSVQSTSTPLPATLAKNETMTVTVAFNPTTVGNWNTQDLMITRSPANGADRLQCKGKAVAAQAKVTFSATSFNFGKHPVGTPAPGKTLSITNTGSLPLSVSVPVLSASGFTCAGFNGTLNCGQAQTIALGFTPPAEGPQTATLSVVSGAPGSPHTITLNGEGCVANAEIAVPPSAPIDFLQVEQGFRTVRFIEVSNPGDGPLQFTGTISGADAALFGLPDPQGSITNAPGTRVYDVLPVSPCGPGAAGSGKTVVAVSFVAADTPRVATASLTLSGSNATNVPVGQTWVFPLTAEITPPVALDVAVVVDHSGSMNDPLGSRVKMEAAVSATQLFVELLRPDLDDRGAIVRFNHLPDVPTPMTPITTTGVPTQNQILQSVPANLPPAQGNTAIAAGAITGAREVLKPRATTPANLKRAVVVLSDGIENTGFEDPSGSGNWFSILGGNMLQPLPASGNVSTSPVVKPGNVDFYSIGLGRDTDIDAAQLEALAGSANHYLHVNQDLTGAKYFELEKYYTQIFMDIVGTSSVADPMFWIAPGQKHEIEFDVLRGDVDALVVLYDFKGMRLPFFCVSPAGEVIDPGAIPAGYQLRAGSTSQARIVEFKMPLKEPDRYAGRWRVMVEHPGMVCRGTPSQKARGLGFLPRDCGEYKDPLLYGIAIGVGSNFRMMPYVTPGPVYVGDPIQLTAVVTEAGLPVTGCTVSVETTAPGGATWTQGLHDDGAHADGSADDGDYGSSFTHTVQPGTYHFRFRATGYSRDGEPVVREAFRDKAVLPRTSTPPGGGGGSGGFERCCKELLEELRQQHRLLKRLIER